LVNFDLSRAVPQEKGLRNLREAFGKLALPSTGVWMASARMGPILCGFIAASGLSSPQYSRYVVAIAWTAGILQVLVAAYQALAAKTNQKEASRHRETAHLVKLGLVATTFVTLVLGIGSYSAAQDWHLTLAIMVACCASGLTQLFSTALWGLGQTRLIAFTSLFESITAIIFVILAVRLTNSATFAIGGLGAASLLTCMIYVWHLFQQKLLARPDGSLAATSGAIDHHVVWPSLINGAASALGPAIALLIAASRASDTAAAYGVAMLFIAGALFPIQILSLAIFPSLMRSHNQAGLRQTLISLAIASLWALGAGFALLLLGPLVAKTLGIAVHVRADTWAIIGLIAFGSAQLSIMGQAIQASGKFWVWAWVNATGAICMIGATAFLPLSINLLLIATIGAIVVRYLISAPYFIQTLRNWRQVG
jgi:O-antigen/teichoic acid export membrane protein